MDYTLPLHALDTFFPVLVVGFRDDKEGEEHGGVHFADLEAADSAGVACCKVG